MCMTDCLALNLAQLTEYNCILTKWLNIYIVKSIFQKLPHMHFVFVLLFCSLSLARADSKTLQRYKVSPAAEMEAEQMDLILSTWLLLDTLLQDTCMQCLAL